MKILGHINDWILKFGEQPEICDEWRKPMNFNSASPFIYLTSFTALQVLVIDQISIVQPVVRITGIARIITYVLHDTEWNPWENSLVY